MKKVFLFAILFMLVLSNSTFAITQQEANQSLASASLALNKMQSAGFNTSLVSSAYVNATAYFDEGNYEKLEYMTKFILDTEKESFFAYNLINNVNAQIENKSSFGYDVSKARSILNSANQSFKAGRYYEAEALANDAVLALSSSSRPVQVVIFHHWFPVVAFLIIVVIAIDFSTPLLKQSKQSHRLLNLKKERQVINKLIQEANSKYYHERVIPKKEFERLVKQYDKKLREIEKLEKELKEKIFREKHRKKRSPTNL